MNEASAAAMDRESINKIKVLVSDKDIIYSSMIVNDITLMGGLVFALDCENNEELSKAALETFKKLSVWPELCLSIRNFIGVIPTLNKIVSPESKYPSTLQHMAIDVLSAITKETPENEKSHDRLGHLGLLQPLSDVANTRRIYNHPLDTDAIKAQRRRRTSTLLRNAKTIVLLIRGMVNKDDEQLVRRSFATVKGVISIIVDFKKKRCTIRAKLSLQLELLAAALSRTMTMTGDQIIKDVEGNEICIPLTSSSSDATCNKENPRFTEDLPAYPEDSPERPPGKDDIVRNGYHHDEQHQGWGFLKTVGKSVGNFFSDSLYW